MVIKDDIAAEIVVLDVVGSARRTGARLMCER
jgi:hypothetical protein